MVKRQTLCAVTVVLVLSSLLRDIDVKEKNKVIVMKAAQMSTGMLSDILLSKYAVWIVAFETLLAGGGSQNCMNIIICN